MYRTVSRALVATLAFGLGIAVGTSRAGEAWADGYQLADDQRSIELGGHLGVVTGGGSSPGGLELGGNFLYRLSDIDWFEGGLRVVIGGGKAACFTDRQGHYLCNHGPVDGRIGELSAGVRRYLLPQDAFRPYAQLRLGLRISTFPGDDTTGVAIPLLAGFGVRGRVNELITVGGSAMLEGGVSLYTGKLGFEPLLALAIRFGVEFTLD